MTALLASLLLAQDKSYELKFRPKPVVGRKVQVDLKENQKMTMTVRSGEQVLQERKDEERYAFQGVEETLKIDGDKVLESKWLFDKAVRIEGEAETALGFQGKPLIASQNEQGAKSFTYEDGTPIEGADLKALQSALGGRRARKDVASPEEVFLPKQAVKVGESWPVDIEKVSKAFGWTAEMIDSAKSKGSVTLKSVSDKEGIEFGAIEASLEIHLKKFGPMELETAVPAKITLTLDAAIGGVVPDGTMTLKMEMSGRSAGKVPDAEQPLDVDVDIRSDNVMTRRSVK
jgi:hypothetical protein